jgi:hypothetical protein
MKVLLILSAMLLTCYVYGELVSFFVSRKAQPRSIVLQIGYAYVLIFFYVFYAALHSAFAAVCSTLIVPVLLSGIALLKRTMSRISARSASGQVARHPAPRRANEIAYFLIAALLVTTFAIWPHVLSGWGNYWQSGNRDAEDGLNGRDAYVAGKIFDTHYDLGKRIGDRSWYDFAKITGTLFMHAPVVNSYRAWYAGDGFRFQYSSLAFWSVLFNEPHGIDILLEQDLVNLLLMFTGIYFLCRHAFLMSGPAAAIASATSLLSTFYLSTFYAGHMGSLMFGALAPAGLSLALSKPEKLLSARAIFAFSALILIAIGFSYPHPLAIIVPPVLLYKLWGRVHFRRAVENLRDTLTCSRSRYVLGLLLILAILAVGVITLGHLTAGYRLRQSDEYRAWGYTRDWLIIPLFLGLIPSPMEGMAFIGATLSPRGYWVLIVCAALFAIGLAVCYCLFRPAANRTFFLFFGAFWVASYIVFRFFIVDSYYLYKFLYTQQFLLIIGVVGFLASTRHRVLRVLPVFVILVNLVSDFALARTLYRRPYNHESGDLTELLKADPNILRGAFVDISGGEGIAVRQVLKAHNVDTSLDPRFAHYFIVPSDREPDITDSQSSEAILRAGRLAIKRAPARNYLMIRTWNNPESAYSDPAVGNAVFRWVSPGKNDNLGIYVIRPDGSGESPGKYLRICFAAGPSAVGNVPVTVTAAAKEVLARIDLDGTRCVWIPSEKALNATQPLLIHSGVKGKGLLPHDDRILLYRVFAVGWTDRIYDDRAISLFNVDHDIVSSGRNTGKLTDPSRPSVRLGQGWQGLETYGRERFRWAGRSPEIILQADGKGSSAEVRLTLEVGPSHGPGPLRLAVVDRNGTEVFEGPDIQGRDTLKLHLKNTSGTPAVYVLRANGKHIHVVSDPRLLEFRVFNITVQ